MILEQIVREQIADRRDQLEAIVRREVERIVAELVDAQLTTNGNGRWLDRCWAARRP